MTILKSALPLAFTGGITLAIMIKLNSQVALFTSALLTSWLAHAVGTVICALILVIVFCWSNANFAAQTSASAPLWAYLGGIPGAFTVLLAAITVNSQLGLSGSIALIMVGQITFGLICDAFGLLGFAKRTFRIKNAITLLLICAGSLLITLGAS